MNADNAACQRAASSRAAAETLRAPAAPAAPVSPSHVPRWRQMPAALEPMVVAVHAATAATGNTQAIDLPLDLPLDLHEHPAAQPALHDDALWGLARRKQGAALRLEFELRTSVARQAFRRDFVHVSRQLHGLESSRRVQGLDRTLLDDALLAVHLRADAVLAIFSRIDAELEATLASHGQADAQVAFARPARFQATIVCPGAHRFVQLVRRADDTLCQVERAWLLGLLSPATKTSLAGDCRRGLLGFKVLARERRQAIGEHVRALNARRAEDAGAVVVPR